MKRPVLRKTAAVGMVAALMLSAGCATTGRGPGDRLDPWEDWNRKVFGFNESLDRNVLKPVATVYSDVVPRQVRRGIDNFFGNAADAWSAVNNMLQGKVELGLQDLIRFSTNTVFGLAGVLDVASEFGLEHHYEDFGQTLGVWGLRSGPYLVWPLLGPSSVRETVALPLDRSVSPAVAIGGTAEQVGIFITQTINTRAGLLQASRVIDDIALDKYTFVRDAYLQRRRSLVLDGEEPAEQPAPGGITPVAPESGAAPAAPPASAVTR